MRQILAHSTCSGYSPASLVGEHFLQSRQDVRHGVWRETAESFHQAFVVYRLDGSELLRIELAQRPKFGVRNGHEILRVERAGLQEFD